MISGHCYSLFWLWKTHRAWTLTQTFWNCIFFLHRVSMCLLTYMYILTIVCIKSCLLKKRSSLDILRSKSFSKHLSLNKPNDGSNMNNHTCIAVFRSSHTKSDESAADMAANVLWQMNSLVLVSRMFWEAKQPLSEIDIGTAAGSETSGEGAGRACRFMGTSVMVSLCHRACVGTEQGTLPKVRTRICTHCLGQPSSECPEETGVLMKWTK